MSTRETDTHEATDGLTSANGSTFMSTRAGGFRKPRLDRWKKHEPRELDHSLEARRRREEIRRLADEMLAEESGEA